MVKKYEDYRDQLEESTPFSPYEMYEVESTEEKSKVVLEGFRKDLCDRLNIDGNTLSAVENEKIRLIIEQASSLIELMPSPKGAELDAQVFQEQQTQQEQEQQQEQQQQVETQIQFSGEQGFKFRKEVYSREVDGIRDSLMTIEKGNYHKYKFEGVPAEQLPDLIVHKQYLSPLESADSSTYTKPITNILVKCLPGGTYRFLACTATGADFYRQEFQRMKNSGGVDKYAIIGFDNHILCSANLTAEEKERLVKSKEVDQMTTYTAFLNAQIKDPYVMRDIVKKYGWTQETFLKLASDIAQRHVSRHPIKLANHTFFEMLCGWKKAKLLQPNRVPLPSAPPIDPERTIPINVTSSSLSHPDNLGIDFIKDKF